MEDHDHGLAHDLTVLAEKKTERRQMLRVLAGLGLVPVIACFSSSTTNSSGDGGTSGDGDGNGDGDASSSSGKDAGSSSGSVDTCEEIPEETQGPYPGDGSNGVNTLNQSGIVRSDITTSFGSMSGTAEGIPLTITFKLVDINDDCSPLVGYAIYAWHCTNDGKYSLYTDTTQNYLRGVQETSADGTVTFKTIFPGCYSGRWPHVHFEIYPTLSKATDANNKLNTSQLALPKAQCAEVYATSGYEASVANLANISLESDMVFADGATLQIGKVTGSVSAGYTATLTVGIAG